MKSNKSGIYWIFNVITGMMYVGSTFHFNKRFWKHKTALRANIHPNKHLQNAWNKYGEANFKFIISEYVEKEKLREVETNWIKWTKSHDRKIGYNLCPVAGSSLGFKQSAETILKMSNANKGKKKSPEAIVKMKLLLTGRKQTEEHKFKKAQAQIGRFMSAETRAKISTSKKKRFVAIAGVRQ